MHASGVVVSCPSNVVLSTGRLVVYGKVENYWWFVTPPKISPLGFTKEDMRGRILRRNGMDNER